jgi:hypothetical protein
MDVVHDVAKPAIEGLLRGCEGSIAVWMSGASSTTTATSPFGVLWIHTDSRSMPARLLDCSAFRAPLAQAAMASRSVSVLPGSMGAANAIVCMLSPLVLVRT